MPTIDGDAHVMEGPQTWEYCDPTERKFMPVLLNPGPEADRQFWLVDGKIRGHVRHVIKPKDFHALAEASGRDMVVPPEAQHLEDEVLHEAAVKMLRNNIGRLPVVKRGDLRSIVGYLGRSNLMAAHLRQLEEEHIRDRTFPRQRLIGIRHTSVT